MRTVQGVTKLPLISPTVAGNHRITGDHNFENGNYAVPSHETRDINNDGGVPTLLISLTNAVADFQQDLECANEDRRPAVQPRITDADRMDTAPRQGAVIPKTSSEWRCARDLMNTPYMLLETTMSNMGTTPYRLMKLETSTLISLTNAVADFQHALGCVDEDRRSAVQPRIADADRMDTAPRQGAVIPKNSRKKSNEWRCSRDLMNTTYMPICEGDNKVDITLIWPHVAVISPCSLF